MCWSLSQCSNQSRIRTRLTTKATKKFEEHEVTRFTSCPSYSSRTSWLRLRNVDRDPHGLDLAGVLAPVRGRAAFGKPFAGTHRHGRFAVLVVGHLALKHVGDRRAIDMVVQRQRAARLHGDAPHAQRPPFA